MRKHLAYSLLFICLLLLALLSQWPASSLATLLARASNNQWQLATPSGSIWNGAGMLLARASPNAPWRNVQNLHWQVQPLALLRGRLSVDLQPEQGQLQLNAGPSGLQANDITLQVPAEAIAPLLPGAFGRYSWHGLLQISGRQFTCNWARTDCQGQMEILWRDAAVAEIPGVILGDYQITVLGQGAATQIQLQTLRGPLQLAGNGEFTADRGLQFSGLASVPNLPAPEQLAAALGNHNPLPNPLAALLGTLGSPTSDGKYRLEYRQTR
jgi:general secretion pathway protein N